MVFNIVKPTVLVGAQVCTTDAILVVLRMHVNDCCDSIHVML